MRRLALEHAVAHLALGILNEQPPLRLFHEHDKRDDPDRDHQDDENERRIVRVRARVQGTAPAIGSFRTRFRACGLSPAPRNDG
jgi:hypothetical protein